MSPIKRAAVLGAIGLAAALAAMFSSAWVSLSSSGPALSAGVPGSYELRFDPARVPPEAARAAVDLIGGEALASGPCAEVEILPPQGSGPGRAFVLREGAVPGALGGPGKGEIELPQALLGAAGAGPGSQLSFACGPYRFGATAFSAPGVPDDRGAWAAPGSLALWLPPLAPRFGYVRFLAPGSPPASVRAALAPLGAEGDAWTLESFSDGQTWLALAPARAAGGLLAAAIALFAVAGALCCATGQAQGAARTAAALLAGTIAGAVAGILASDSILSAFATARGLAQPAIPLGSFLAAIAGAGLIFALAAVAGPLAPPRGARDSALVRGASAALSLLAALIALSLLPVRQDFPELLAALAAGAALCLQAVAAYAPEAREPKRSIWAALGIAGGTYAVALVLRLFAGASLAPLLGDGDPGSAGAGAYLALFLGGLPAMLAAAFLGAGLRAISDPGSSEKPVGPLLRALPAVVLGLVGASTALAGSAELASLPERLGAAAIPGSISGALPAMPRASAPVPRPASGTPVRWREVSFASLADSRGLERGDSALRCTLGDGLSLAAFPQESYLTPLHYFRRIFPSIAVDSPAGAVNAFSTGAGRWMSQYFEAGERAYCALSLELDAHETLVFVFSAPPERMRQALTAEVRAFILGASK